MPNIDSIDAKIQKLEAEKKRAAMKIQDLKRKAAAARKKNNSRTKILVGVAVLEAMQSGAIRKDTVENLLSKFITSERDREFILKNTDFRLNEIPRPLPTPVPARVAAGENEREN